MSRTALVLSTLLVLVAVTAWTATVSAQDKAPAKSDAIADARKFYDFVVRKHPRHELAAAAKKRLEVLLKL